MVNDCIRLSLPRRDFAYESVKRACRPRMDEYPVEDSYRISAMFEASNLLKKYLTDSRRRKVRPPSLSPSLPSGFSGGLDRRL